ncbi:hypothetical protein ACWDZW_06575 [Streptomyces coeruleorubidus]
MGITLEPIELPDWAWERADVRQALRKRDIGAVFRHVQRYAEPARPASPPQQE